MARCWVRTRRRQGRRHETRVVVEVRTADQVPEMRLIEEPAARRSGSEVRGALLVLLEFEAWPRWMPMCQTSEVLRRWGPGELLTRLDFKLPVVGVHLRTTCYIRLIDRLEEEGCLEMVVCSVGSALAAELLPGAVTGGAGDRGAAATSFLGVALPGAARWARVGVHAEVDYASLRIWPTGGGGGEHLVRFVMAGEERCPLDRVINMIWRMLARNLVPILARRACEAPIITSRERADFYTQLERKVVAASARAEAASRQGPPKLATAPVLCAAAGSADAV